MLMLPIRPKTNSIKSSCIYPAATIWDVLPMAKRDDLNLFLNLSTCTHAGPKFSLTSSLVALLARV